MRGSDLLSDAPPVSATEALRLLDAIIAVSGIWTDRKGDAAQVQQTYRRWLLQVRPYVAEAAARSNDR